MVSTDAGEKMTIWFNNVHEICIEYPSRGILSGQIICYLIQCSSVSSMKKRTCAWMTHLCKIYTVKILSGLYGRAEQRQRTEQKWPNKMKLIWAMCSFSTNIYFGSNSLEYQRTSATIIWFLPWLQSYLLSSSLLSASSFCWVEYCMIESSILIWAFPFCRHLNREKKIKLSFFCASTCTMYVCMCPCHYIAHSEQRRKKNKKKHDDENVE